MTATTIPARDVLLDAFDADCAAREAADEVLGRLTRAQCAGVDPLLPGDEFLLAEAESRRAELMRLLGLRTERPRAAVPAVAGDWRDRADAVDWTCGGVA